MCRFKRQFQRPTVHSNSPLFEDRLAATHPVVLVRGDRREPRLLEHERFVVLLGVFLTVFAGIHVDDVEPRLVSMHGVQDDLLTRQKTTDVNITVWLLMLQHAFYAAFLMRISTSYFLC